MQTIIKNTFSYTRLKTFEECRLRYFKHYVLGIPEPITDQKLFGKVVHAVIDRMVKGQALDRAIDEAIDETVGLDQSARFDRAEIERLVRVARVEGAQYGAGLSKRHFFLELEPLDPQSPILQGYIDFLDGDLRITDWQTSWSVYHPTEDFKLALKALALAEMHGLERVEARLVFLRAKKEERVQAHVYTREEMEEARAWALQLAQRAMELERAGTNEAHFPPNYGPHCEGCPWAEACGTKVAQSVSVTQTECEVTEEEAQQIAGMIFTLEAATKSLKERLKAFVQRSRTPVVCGDRAWDMYPAICWELSPEAKRGLFRVLNSLGEDPWEYISFSKSDIDKMLSKTDLDEEVLTGLGARKKTTYSFRANKIKKAGGRK